MNPPAAIQNAMGRERKPFTYTPGGLDLSEIKSERMARRLMRNAMSPGVQEPQSPSVQSPTGAPPAFPPAALYSNLPVQVFPAFQLPANPKTLLRTRSTPYRARESSVDRTPPQYMYAPPPNGAYPRESYVPNIPPTRSNAERSLVEACSGSGYPPPTRSNIDERSPVEACSGSGYPPPTRSNIAERSPVEACSGSGYPLPVDAPVRAQAVPQVSAHAPSPPNDVRCNGAADLGRVTPSIIFEPCLMMPSELLQRHKTKSTTPNDEEIEVEATIKITKPKKTISTSVEIERKILPDGTVEETKTTTTNTIINGKVEDSKVQKESRILSEAEAKEVIEEESEEEEEEEEEEVEEEKQSNVIQNGICKEINVSESKTETKKTVVTTEIKEESTSETNPESKTVFTTTETKVETKTNGEPQEIKRTITKETTQSDEEEEDEEEEEDYVENDDNKVETTVVVKDPEPLIKEVKTLEESEEEEEEEYEEVEDEEEEEVVEENIKKDEVIAISQQDEVEDEAESNKEEDEVIATDQNRSESDQKDTEQNSETKVSTSIDIDNIHITNEEKHDTETEARNPVVSESKNLEIEDIQMTDVPENVISKTETSETKTETISSPSQIPEVHTTSKKESTEITSSVSDDPFGHPISTQTELHRVENIVTINKTIKTLDNSYEQLTQHGLPTVRTYFAPPTREKISTSPQPAKPYTPTFTSEKNPERRHSLLLDRLSIERQVAPAESYHNTYNLQSNQSTESVTKDQLIQEPQSEVLHVSNVKPSSISNSQWYQAPKLQNVIYNNVQPSTPTTQTLQQPSYIADTSYEPPRPASTYQAAEAPTYVPKSSNWGSSNLGNLDSLPSINAQSNQYSFMSNKKTTESFNQQSTSTPQSSGYIPPPWEIEKSGTYEAAPHYYQGPSSAPATVLNSAPAWKPAPQHAPAKPRVSYQPPAPNASFVKQATPAPKQTPGRKTYYSEYERRYISVPESTYIPADTKVQPQWDASPQYYYDNPEPVEEVEQPWRKELREFTEKTTKVEERTVIQPPWQEDINQPKNTPVAYTPQPTWSQTLRPRSYRETSFDSETLQYQNTQEWPKSNTLNKRPVSAFVKTRLDSPSFERTRGVSVDRYNATSYQPPAPYTPSANDGYSLPWETQEQGISPAPYQYSDAATSQLYHNPQVPAYHVRSPTEPREYHASQQPRWSGQGRERPVQSRSFKYLQMLTGTEDGAEQHEPFVAQHPQHATPRPRRV